MKCPYCGKETEEGVIQSPNEISWQREKHLFGGAELHDGAVCLSKHSFFKGSSVVAFLCRDCGKIIIDIPKE